MTPDADYILALMSSRSLCTWRQILFPNRPFCCGHAWPRCSFEHDNNATLNITLMPQLVTGGSFRQGLQERWWTLSTILSSSCDGFFNPFLNLRRSTTP